jgi:hypothetical protein
MAGRGAFAKYGVSVPDGSVKARNSIISAAASAHDRVMAAGGTAKAATLAGSIAAHNVAGNRGATLHGPEGSFKGVRAGTKVMQAGGGTVNMGAKLANRETATNAGPRAVNRDAATNAGPRAASREAATNAGLRAVQAPPKSGTNIVGLSSDVVRAGKANPTQISAGHIQQNWALLPEHYRGMVREHPVVKAGLMSPEYAYANILGGMRPHRGGGDAAAHWDSEFRRNLGSGRDAGAANFRGVVSGGGGAAPAGARRALPPTLVNTVAMGGGVAETMGMTPPAKTIGMTGAGPKAQATTGSRVTLAKPPQATGAGPKATNAGPKAPSARPELGAVKVPGKRVAAGNDNRVKQTKGERSAAAEARKKANEEKRAQRAAERAARQAERAKAKTGGGKGRRGKAGGGERGKGGEKAGSNGKGGAALATMIRKIVELPLQALQSAAGSTGEMVGGGGKKGGGH